LNYLYGVDLGLHGSTRPINVPAEPPTLDTPSAAAFNETDSLIASPPRRFEPTDGSDKRLATMSPRRNGSLVV